MTNIYSSRKNQQNLWIQECKGPQFIGMALNIQELHFSVNSAKKSFTEKSCLMAHIQFVHETFKLICNECKFKKNIQGYIYKHIIQILKGKLPHCELCHDMPTLKAAMEKHIYL